MTETETSKYFVKVNMYNNCRPSVIKLENVYFFDEEIKKYLRTKEKNLIEEIHLLEEILETNKLLTLFIK